MKRHECGILAALALLLSAPQAWAAIAPIQHRPLAVIQSQRTRDPVAWLRSQQRLIPAHLAAQRIALLLASPHAFFRGTAIIYAHDVARFSRLSKGLKLRIQGDAHLENVGSIPVGKELLFGPNDFDESCQAPLAYELTRLLCSIQIAAKAHAQDGDRLSARFLSSYLAEAKAGGLGRMRGPGQKAIQDAQDAVRDREDWMEDLVKDQRIKSSRRNLTLGPQEHARLLQALVGYAKTRSEGASFYQVKDAKQRLAGLGSYGRPRYWVLLEGPSPSPKDDVLLDIKSANLPAWHGVAGAEGTGGDPAQRVFTATQAFLKGGDPHLGTLHISNLPFVVRERTPSLSGEVDLDDLKAEEWAAFIDDLAAAYAAAHLRVGAQKQQLAADCQANGAAMLAFAKAYPAQLARDMNSIQRAFP